MRIRIFVAACLVLLPLCFFASSALAASPPASGGSAAMPGASGGATLPLPDPTVELAQLQAMFGQIGTAIYNAIVPCLRVVGSYALECMLAVGGLGLAFGSRGRPLATVFVEVCVLSAIVWVFCVAMWPQTLLGTLRSSLLPSATQLGNQIAHLGPGVGGTTPTQWLMSWLNGGVVPASGGLDVFGNNSSCKFSMYYIENVLWHVPDWGTLSAESHTVTQDLQKAADSGLSWAIGMWTGFLFGLGSLFATLLFVYLTAIVSVLGFGLTQLFVLGGGELAWNLYIPLGMLLVPLIYLGIGRDYWRHYLTTLVALAIMPSLFWLMSGIGIALTAGLYQSVFANPAGGSVGNFVRGAVVWATNGMYSQIWQVINSILNLQGLQLPSPGQGPTSGGGFNLTQFLLWTFHWSGFFLRYTAGVAMVAAFVALATTVAVTSVQIAFSWTRAFSDAAAAWIGAHRDSIDRIGSSIGSGVGHVAGGLTQQVGDFLSNWRRR
ncbi:hypothetical protein [Methylacidimicrobium sp. B4]|uniref:hypothetical protein n=1 Tax=Methylacidimicrobium sp. B4 TaxID=2796139 RepID=UPI001A909A78|nr:hypothetical protein [Methylacidimicrobium sp. B4]QSR84578.1 hypothetical protein MacB4_10335 [Methylacidimicrobium sp. B4]